MLHTTAGCDLSLSKVFISFYEEESGQENIAIILKSNFFYYKKMEKMVQTVIEAHKRKKWNFFDYLSLWNNHI